MVSEVVGASLVLLHHLHALHDILHSGRDQALVVGATVADHQGHQHVRLTTQLAWLHHGDGGLADTKVGPG